MKYYCKVLSFALCAVLAFNSPGLVAAETTSEKTSDDVKEDIKKQQNELSGIQDEKKGMQQSISSLNQQKTELQEKKDDLTETVSFLDQELVDVQAAMLQLEEELAQAEGELNLMEVQLKEAEQTESAQYESMKERIRFLYEKGDSAYISMVFGAGSFSEMLNKAQYVEEVSAYDRNLLEDYKESTININSLKTQIEDEIQSIEDTKAKVAAEEEKMSGLITEKNNQITAYENDIENKEEAIKEYEAMIAQNNATIAALESAILKAEKEAAELEKKEKGISDNDIDETSSSKKVYNGPFCWPAPSYTRISDDYGNRIHPTLGVEQFHNGIDMAAPGGSPILAAQSGTVVAAAYSATMGNYIMINHGGGLVTIYMHASALYVSTGQTVTKGQKIAAVGTTGRSTGNHLHFSVRLNGSYVNPHSYL